MRRSPEIRRLGWLTARPIAHRGLHGIASGAVENTATAFACAVEHGYAIECDLQLSGDGEAVVFHDATLDRLTNETGPVAARTAKELKRAAFKRGPDRIQTLAELLEQVAGKVPLFLELKSHWDANQTLVERVLAVLASYGGAHALMSFDPDAVEAVRLASPATLRGIVADRTTDPFYRTLPLPRRLELRHFGHFARTRPHFASFRWQDLPFSPVGALRRAGLPVISWTIRSPADAPRARRYSDQITFEGFLA